MAEAPPPSLQPAKLPPIFTWCLSEAFLDVTEGQIVPNYGELRRSDGTTQVIQDSLSTSRAWEQPPTLMTVLCHCS